MDLSPNLLVKLGLLQQEQLPLLRDADAEQDSPAHTAISERSRDTHWVLGSPSPRRFQVRHFYINGPSAPRLFLLVHFGDLTEGVPGVVHAGATAALLDHAAIVWSYANGGVATYLTATLSTDYLLRVSAGNAYVIEAAKTPKPDGEGKQGPPSRRTDVSLRLLDINGTLLARCAAFIVRKERPAPSL